MSLHGTVRIRSDAECGECVFIHRVFVVIVVSVCLFFLVSVLPTGATHTTYLYERNQNLHNASQQLDIKRSTCRRHCAGWKGAIFSYTFSVQGDLRVSPGMRDFGFVSVLVCHLSPCSSWCCVVLTRISVCFPDVFLVFPRDLSTGSLLARPNVNSSTYIVWEMRSVSTKQLQKIYFALIDSTSWIILDIVPVPSTTHLCSSKEVLGVKALLSDCFG